MVCSEQERKTKNKPRRSLGGCLRAETGVRVGGSPWPGKEAEGLPWGMLALPSQGC